MHRVQCRQWKFGKCRGYQYPWYRVCTKPMFISKGSYGYGEAKNAFALSVQITHWVLRTSKINQVSCIAVYGRQWKFGKIRGYQYPWCRVCTKPMFISKGSYGYGRVKNAFALSVQITHLVLRTSKIYKVSFIFVYGRQWKFGKIGGYQYPWYRVCTKPMFISKGSYGYGKVKNVFALLVQITHWVLRTPKIYQVSCIAV